MKSWASVLLQEKRLHLSQGLSKRMSRPTGTPVALRELPKGCRSTFGEFARRIPPNAPSGRHPRERGRPARMLSLRLPLSFPAMLQPTALPAGTAWARPTQSLGALAGRPGWRRWPRLREELCGRDARAPGGALFHDIVEPKEVYPSSCLFVFIRGSSSLNNPVHPVHPCSISRKPV